MHTIQLLVVCILCARVRSHAWLCKLQPHGLEPAGTSPSGSSVHGIFQGRIVEWVAISYSRGSSPPRDGITSLASPALAEMEVDSSPSATWEVLYILWVWSNLQWHASSVMFSIIQSSFTVLKTLYLFIPCIPLTPQNHNGMLLSRSFKKNPWKSSLAQEV